MAYVNSVCTQNPGHFECNGDFASTTLVGSNLERVLLIFKGSRTAGQFRPQ